jgi:hypothetical protein
MCSLQIAGEPSTECFSCKEDCSLSFLFDWLVQLLLLVVPNMICGVSTLEEWILSPSVEENAGWWINSLPWECSSELARDFGDNLFITQSFDSLSLVTHSGKK